MPGMGRVEPGSPAHAGWPGESDDYAATPLKVEFLKCKRGKDKATFQGFVYTMTKSSSEVQQLVYEMRGVCKARMHSRGDE